MFDVTICNIMIHRESALILICYGQIFFFLVIFDCDFEIHLLKVES